MSDNLISLSEREKDCVFGVHRTVGALISQSLPRNTEGCVSASDLCERVEKLASEEGLGRQAIATSTMKGLLARRYADFVEKNQLGLVRANEEADIYLRPGGRLALGLYLKADHDITPFLYRQEYPSIFVNLLKAVFVDGMKCMEELIDYFGFRAADGRFKPAERQYIRKLLYNLASHKYIDIPNIRKARNGHVTDHITFSLTDKSPWAKHLYTQFFSPWLQYVRKVEEKPSAWKRFQKELFDGKLDYITKNIVVLTEDNSFYKAVKDHLSHNCHRRSPFVGGYNVVDTLQQNNGVDLIVFDSRNIQWDKFPRTEDSKKLVIFDNPALAKDAQRELQVDSYYIPPNNYCGDAVHLYVSDAIQYRILNPEAKPRMHK